MTTFPWLAAFMSGVMRAFVEAAGAAAAGAASPLIERRARCVLSGDLFSPKGFGRYTCNSFGEAWWS